jgi:glycosyltransferase A (GT-A) superfamily protein (DUF2064 family)
MRSWLGERPEYAPQHGGDLGERMAHAFENAWRITDRAVLVGTDVPDYPQELVAGSLDVLGEVDAVIAPAVDGGYCVIGFHKNAYRREFFQGLSWGRDSVFRDTLARLEGAGLTVDVLPEWNDVDHGIDVRVLLEKAGAGEPGEPDWFHSAGMRTRALLEAHRDLLRRFPPDAPTVDGRSLRERLDAARRAIRARLGTP